MSRAIDLKSSIPVDRRRHRRFPITAYGECLLHGRRAEVVTTDISSAGILVQSADTLPIDATVELRMDWPALLDGRYPLRLVVAGKVLRTTTRGTVIRVARYEYRLAPKMPVDFAREPRHVSITLP